MSEQYFSRNSNGENQVSKINVFDSVEFENLLKLEFSKVLEKLDKLVIDADSTISSNALNNCHGDWYEWILAIHSWNQFVKFDDCHLMILVPNVAQFDVNSLYTKRLYSYILDLKAKVEAASGITLITSNPDFVIIDGNKARSMLRKIEPCRNSKSDILMLESLYQCFIGTCELEDIVGYVSVKTSLRPDRRLQMAHEGSLLKAIYTHLITRDWVLKPKGISYFGIAGVVGPSDVRALKTVATHSIVTVNSLPIPAVDSITQVNSIDDFTNFCKIALRSIN